MNPTLADQLRGTCRILDEVVAPAVTADYPADILRALISNLAMLASASTELPDFFAWDNAASEELLRAALPALPDEQAAQLSAEIAAALVHISQPEGLNLTNEALRGSMSRLIVDATLGPSSRAAFARHFLERAKRNPIRYAITLPSAT